MAVPAALVLAALALLTGCFTYASPDASDAPQPGTSVRVELTSVGVDRLEGRIGRRHRTMDGPLVSRDPDSLRIDMVVRGYRTASGSLYRDTVSIPTEDVRELRVRTFSPGRTAVVGVAAAAAAYAAVLTLDLGGGESTGGDDGGEVFSRIPLLRLLH